MSRFSGGVATIPTLVERAQELEPRTHLVQHSSTHMEYCAISGWALCGAMLFSAGLWVLIIMGARHLWLLMH